MSLTQNDRNLRSVSGRKIQRAPDPVPGFAVAIAAALRREFGGSPGAVKAVARVTLANERAVRNWFEAKNGPSGDNLIALIQVSDEVLEAVLRLAGRPELVAAQSLTRARAKLQQMLELIDDLDASEPG